jgi:hypothetical protein
MNKKFYIYQRRDNPKCGYGMTGYIMFGGDSGFDLLFIPDDGALAFEVSDADIFGLPKGWKKRRVNYFFRPKKSDKKKKSATKAI